MVKCFANQTSTKKEYLRASVIRSGWQRPVWPCPLQRVIFILIALPLALELVLAVSLPWIFAPTVDDLSDQAVSPRSAILTFRSALPVALKHMTMLDIWEQ